jgi:2-keto-3-deoxy-L-rhamnonate aldolase RhmA
VESVELIALAGYDFIVIDLEHTTISIETASSLIATALFTGVSPLVRVPTLDGGVAQRLLDAGAEGLMVPHVDTVAHAEAAANAVRFPPRGSRGVGANGRAGAYGTLPREEYLRYGAEEVVLIAQIESAQAARNAAAIAAVDGIDALFIGIADLSTSALLAEDDPAVTELVNGAIGASHATGTPIGFPGGASAASIQAAVEAGYDFTMMSSDAGLLGAAASAAITAGRAVRSRLSNL